MALWRWLVVVPLVVLFVIFVLANRHPVMLDFWPLPMQIQLPLFLITLGLFLLGFLLGALVVAVRQLTAKGKLRAQEEEIRDLETKLARLKTQLAAAEAKAADKGTHLPPPPPA